MFFHYSYSSETTTNPAKDDSVFKLLPAVLDNVPQANYSHSTSKAENKDILVKLE